MRKTWYWQHLVPAFFLGISSGLPLALVGNTLQAWFTEAGVSLQAIGALTLVGLPYVLKPLWSPFFDRFTCPWLGRRRGWLVLVQGLCVCTLLVMSQLSPTDDGHGLAWVACLLAFLSASQDIVYDAWRIDVLTPDERSMGAACGTAGYRIGMLVSGGLALIMASHWGWERVYVGMAALIGLFAIVTCLAPEPVLQARAPTTLREAVVAPMVAFFQSPMVWWVLGFIVLYKIGDAFALALSTTFLLRELHFTLSDVGWLYKSVGMASTLLGAFVGGWWQPRMGLYKSLWYFGILQAVSNIMFAVLLWVGKSYSVLVLTIVIEYFCGGMGTAVFVAFLMGLCDHRYSATQYALLTSVASLGRVFIGPLAAMVVGAMGWMVYFLLSVVLCVPGLWALWCLRRHAVFTAPHATTVSQVNET